MATQQLTTGLARLSAFLAVVLAAISLAGCSGSDSETSDTSSTTRLVGVQPPPALNPTGPIMLSASVVSSTEINLAWTRFVGTLPVTGYVVIRDGVEIARLALVNSYLDSGLTPGSTHGYTVEAIYNDGTTDGRSGTVFATTSGLDTTPPSTPSGLSASALSSSRIDLSWTASTDNVGVVGYGIYRNATLVALIANVTSYQDTGLTSSTTYSYSVDAFDAAGNVSPQSIAASATTPFVDTTPPTVPAGVNATAASASRINLTWTASTDNVAVTGYIIRRNGSVVAEVGNVTTHADAGLAASTTYAYTVEATDAEGNLSGESASASATTDTLDTTAPSVPTGLAANAVSSSQINLSWTASTDNVGVVGYTVRRNGAVIANLGNVTTFQNTGLAPSTTYSYRVSAFDAAGNISAQSLAASATTQAAADTTPPSVPTGLTAIAVSASQINLSWTASIDDVGVTGYRIYRGGTFLANTPGNVTAYQNTGLAASTTYSYTVEAVDAAGNPSGQSSSASATTASPGAIVISLVPNRTSGVAPLAVHFDASGTTDPGTSRPFHDLEYRWDFGDSAGSPVSGAVWNVGSRAGTSSRNSATGPIAAHVFETPGNYTVTLNVTNGTSTALANVLIQVQDPNTVFAGTSTRCFSTSGNFSGCPAGAQQITTSGFSNVVSNAAPGRRLLLRRGETWTTSGSTISATGPGILGAFGSGAKPIVRASSDGIVLLEAGGASNWADWRFMDIEADGDNRAQTTGILPVGEVRDLTFLRVDVRNTTRGVLAYVDEAGHMPSPFPFDQFTFADCTITNSADYGMFITARHLALLGTVIDGVVTEHVLRSHYMSKSVIANSELRKGAEEKHLLKLAGFGFGASVAYNEQVVLSDNRFVGGSDGWMVALSPQASTYDERVRDVILERNWFKSGPNAGSNPLIVNAREITIRNNIFDHSGGASSVEMVSVFRRGVEPAPTHVRIHNNSFFTSRTLSSGNFVAVSLSSPASNVSVINNLAYAPNATGPIFLSSGGASNVTALTNSSNTQVKNTNPGWTASPSSPTDFALSAGSYAINAGTTIPVHSDFFRVDRPQGSLFDMGAAERP